MTNNKMFNPIIILAGEGGLTPTDEPVIGGGSAHGSYPATEPVSYADWKASSAAYDITLDEVIDEYDYARWWESYGFTREQWESLNPTLPWDTYFP